MLKFFLVLCFLLVVAYAQLNQDETVSDLEGAESANPQWGYGGRGGWGGGYGRGGWGGGYGRGGWGGGGYGRGWNRGGGYGWGR